MFKNIRTFFWGARYTSPINKIFSIFFNEVCKFFPESTFIIRTFYARGLYLKQLAAIANDILSSISFHLWIDWWLYWVFAAAHRLSLGWGAGAALQLQCAGFSLQWLLLLWITGSRVPKLR